MSLDDDGGPAFPIVETDPNCGTRIYHGLSLRDWFAGRAPVDVMQYLESYGKLHRAPVSLDDFCDLRYEYADAMLRARSKEPTQ